MHFRPEDVKSWKVIETESVEMKVQEIFKNPDRKILKEIYDRLKMLLQTYPPDQRYFSYPRQDLQSHMFWVKSENGQVMVRAIYNLWAETCVIDKVFLASEKHVEP